MKLLSKVYLAFLILTPLVPKIESADVVAGHYVGLSIATLIGMVLLIYQKKSLSTKIIKLRIPLYLFSGYMLIAFISIFFAINQIESFITISKAFLVFANLYILYNLIEIEEIEKVKKFSIGLISILLFIEVIAVLIPLVSFTDIFNHEFSNSLTYMKGLAGNKNIAAVSITTKIYLLIYLMYYFKNKLFSYLGLILLFIASSAVIYSGTRTAYIGLILLIIVLFISLIPVVNKYFHLNLKKQFLALLTIIFSIAFYYFFSSSKENDRASLENRIEFINPSNIDNSGKQRIRFYKQAIDFSFENILMGVGIGNWKIISIKLDGQNMTSYVVPYNLHNDFLEVFGEMGILGFLFYTLFFVSLYYLIFSLLKSKEFEDKGLLIFLFLGLSMYVIDALLNFPQFRVLNQVNLMTLVLLIILSSSKNKSLENDK